MSKRSRNKPRAWSNMVGKLETFQDAELSARTQEIFEERDKYAKKYNLDRPEDLSMDQLRDEIAELDALEEVAKFEASKRSLQYAAIEGLILKHLERIKEVTGGAADMWRGDGHTFSPKYSPRAKVTDAAALLKWIRERNEEHLLTLPAGRLNSIIKDIFDPEIVALLTPEQRAELKPGDAASFQPPPGVSVYLQTSVHHTDGSSRRSTRAEGPFDEE